MSAEAEVIYKQTKAMLEAAEATPVRMEAHALKVTADFEKRTAELESKMENLAQQVRAPDVI